MESFSVLASLMACHPKSDFSQDWDNLATTRKTNGEQLYETIRHNVVINVARRVVFGDL